MNIRQYIERICGWLASESHMRQARRLQAVFTTHPHETGETYLVHLWFTAKMGFRFAFVSFVILVHGVFPFLFTRTASIHVEQLYRIMKMRIPKKRLEEIDRERLYARKPHEGITGEARIAIVGGGFSGVATLVNLVQLARRPMTVEWFVSDMALGEGVAYSTRYNTHLLNVHANNMGILANQREGFYQWLKTAKGSTRVARVWPGHEVEAASYVPRMLYAEYLRAMADEAVQAAKERGIEVNLRHAEVTDATLFNADAQQINLLYDVDGQRQSMLVDSVVLATGNLPPRKLGFQSSITESDGYIPDVWKVIGDAQFARRVAAFPTNAEIVIIGSGLTMVDAVLALQANGYKGKITAISRSGQQPAVHKACKEYPAWEWVTDPRNAPTKVYKLLHRFRHEVRTAKSRGYDWRAVVDSLRPVTQLLWQRLDIDEKRKFLSRVYTLWSNHRHRMAEQVHVQLQELKERGALQVAAGSIYYVGKDAEGLVFAYRKRCRSDIVTLHPVLVINCSGPEYDIANSNHMLLKNLRDRGLITVGPLRMGVELDSSGAAKGSAPDTLFVVGPLLAGEYLECTAVPELREVASQVAAQVLCRVDMIAHEDVASGLSLGEWI